MSKVTIRNYRELEDIYGHHHAVLRLAMGSLLGLANEAYTLVDTYAYGPKTVLRWQ